MLGLTLTLTLFQASSKRKRSKEVHVKLFQYSCWPECGPSDNPLSLLEFTHQTQQSGEQGPVLVMAG